ncbi:Tho complex subunit 2 [Paragonimus heterotremus]|uniref:THO complex subunit 2 n=1 Tax=Paragonimus heterotremus TaxID=100268 RepID=A0A8J4SPQ1_9TREM|nr:Tho complex subunit 2 [Paragonimus heterotremus]
MDPLLAVCQNPVFVSSCLKDWDKFGKKNFLVKCRDGGLQLSLKLLLDLFVRLLSGDGKVDMLTKLLPEIIKNFRDDPSFESKLLDILWFLDTAIYEVQSEAVRDRYFRLLHLCKTHVNPALLMERLSEDTLENMSIIQSKQQFQTRYVRTKTRLFFKQQKFNLLREENEGYAKLITELAQTTGPMEAVMTQVRSLIGYFDLDPNRVLDLILDACEFRENMSQQFLKLIRLYNPDKHDLTHILGHKFHFTQEPDIVTPPSLYKVAALLVSEGFVNLDVLYSHLYPSDTEIQTARTRLLSSAKAYRPLAPSSMAFASSTAINSSLNNILVNDASRSEPGLLGNVITNPGLSFGVNHEPSSHNIVLNGVWASSGPPRNLDDSSPSEDNHLSVADNAVLSEMVEDKDLDITVTALYENNQKLELCSTLLRMGDWINAQAILDRFPGYWATGHHQLCRSMCELLHYLIEPLYAKVCPLPVCLQRYRHRPSFKTFCSGTPSSIRLAPVKDFTQLARTVLPVAAYLGPNMSTDVVLLVKFCRLGYAYISDPNTRTGTIEVVYQGFFNLLDEVLLPSLNLVDANCCLAEEIWQLMRFMPYDHRYRLYGQWRHISAQNEPRIIRKNAQMLVRAKAIMKRLSKENVKPMGRQLGTLSHSNPGLLFDHVLNTVQLYTNLVGPVVEALKYVSSLGYDVLTFCIIEALIADETKLEDLQLSQSLQALSAFTGLLCKKYQFDLSGLLQYVLNQLKVGKSYDLQILREILHRMSGIDISEDMTDEQLQSMSGGELLLQEGGYYAQIRNTRKNATRLKDALIEHNMIMPFIFLMAQQRDAVLFLDDPDRHVKLAGRLYDQCQGTLVQFITFLGLQLTREEMQTQCLPIERMMGEFHVPADTAFCLYRSLFEQRVSRMLETKERADSNRAGDQSKSSTKALFAAISQQLCGEIAAAIRPLYPSRVWDELGTNFFVTFWTLHSSDLVVPEAAYQRQVLQLREQMQQIETAPNGWTSAKKKREIERLQGLVDKLAVEQTERHEHVARVRAWLLAERDSWFQTRLATKTDTITQFLQLCIYPRVCFTAADAIYAAQFMHVLHQLKTSRFSTLICLDRIFNDITLPTSMCTEDEAHRYGRFLCAVLELVMRWHSSEELFNSECGQFPGFVTVFRKGSDANTKADQLQFENYRHVVHKWHYRITKATVACLESGSYVQIRNALIILTRILPQYPRILQFGSAVERRVLKLKEEEKDRRPDLKALAFSYAGLLLPRKAKWVSEEEFHYKENKPLRCGSVSGLSTASGAHSSSVATRVPTGSERGHHPARSVLNHQANVSGPPTENQPSVNYDSSSSAVRRPVAAPSFMPAVKSSSSVNDPRSRTHSACVVNAPIAVSEASSRSVTSGPQQTVTVNGPTHSNSPSNKQRSVQRSDVSAPSHSSDYTGGTVDELQGSKRRRMEASSGNNLVSGSTNVVSSPSNSSAQKVSSPIRFLSCINVVE